MAVWNGEELLWTAATFLAWASLVALWIAWDAHVKFRVLLDTPRPDELGHAACLGAAQPSLAGHRAGDVWRLDPLFCRVDRRPVSTLRNSACSAIVFRPS